MKSYSKLIVPFFLLAFLFCPNSILCQTSGYKISGKIFLEGENRWDYLAVDQTYHRLFVSDNTKVHVIDIEHNSVVGEITGLNGVHRIAFAPEFNKGFITSGRDSVVMIFDLKSLKQIDKIKVNEKNPDAIVYDSYSKQVFAMNHTSGSATVINASTWKIVSTIFLGGTAEFAASNLNGRIYVSLEDQSSVCVIDTMEFKVIAKWPIAPCESPTGMAIDIKNNRLFITCGNELMAILDLSSGKVIATVPIGKGSDGCAFDPGTKFILSSNGSGTMTIVKQKSPNDYLEIENVETLHGARTIAVDEKTHKVFTSALLNKPDSDQKSFGVLILDYKSE